MDIELLRQTFNYEPDTGMLRRTQLARKPYPWRAAAYAAGAAKYAGAFARPDSTL